MAETSGFFQAMWDASLKNPITEEYTGWWDRDYTAQSYADMFALFIGNGVFGSPTNQLKVIPGTGLSVVVTPGWAFINGTWYHNDSEKTITIPANSGSSSRIDSIKVRFNASNREITTLGFTGDISVTRGTTYYDLKLAEVIVPVAAVEISASNITDTRMNESVCGLVKGLMEIETTEDLFAQYESQFNDWFDTVKDQVTGDLAIRLQMEFTQLNEYTTQALETANQLVEEYTTRDFVIAEQQFAFTNNVCRIEDSRVTATSLVDVYFTQETINEAVRCAIYVESYNGYILLTAQRAPTSTIRGTIGVRVR